VSWQDVAIDESEGAEMDAEDDGPEMTIQAISEHLGQLDNAHWMTARSAFVSRAVLGNLLLALHREGVFDAVRFLAGIHACAADVPSKPDREALAAFAADLLQRLGAPLRPPGDPTPPAGTLFH
jgi:hypothetical protein